MPRTQWTKTCNIIAFDHELMVQYNDLQSCYQAEEAYSNKMTFNAKTLTLFVPTTTPLCADRSSSYTTAAEGSICTT